MNKEDMTFEIIVLIGICLFGFNYINLFPINESFNGRYLSLIYSLSFPAIAIYNVNAFLKELGEK